MIIKSCYIENFGIFHQESFSFLPGLNIIKEENGWGKSTLAAFMKAMFYGMEYKLRSKELYDRTKYLPWQGGNYGGYLIFEINNIEYKLIRYFGKKSIDDEFELYHTTTNKLSDDYSSNIGEEIFGIDCDSFERSIYITLDGKPPLMQDSIQAKLGNLIDNTDDINNFESAYRTLDTLATSIKAKRGSGGKLSEVEQNINRLQEKLKECDNAGNQLLLIQDELTHQQMLKKGLETKQKSLQNEMKQLTLHGKKREYLQLLERQQAQQQQADTLLQTFQGTLPSEQDLNDNGELVREITALDMRLGENNITDEEREELSRLWNIFDPVLPAQSELEQCQNYISANKTADAELDKHNLSSIEKKEYHALYNKYKSYCPTPEDINKYIEQYDELASIKEKIVIQEMQLKTLREALNTQDNQTNRKKSAIIIASILLFGTSIALSLLLSPIWIGGIGFLISILVILFGLLHIKSGKHGDLDKYDKIDEEEKILIHHQNEMRLLESEVSMFMERLQIHEDDGSMFRLLSEIKVEVSRLSSYHNKQKNYQQLKNDLYKNMEESKEFIAAFLDRFRNDSFDWDDEALLTHIIKQKERYINLKCKIDEHNHLVTRQQKLETKVSLFFERYILPKNLTYIEQMERIRDTYRDYQNIQKELQASEAQMKQFQLGNDVDALTALTNPVKTMDELHGESDRYDQQITQTVAVITDCEKRIDDLSIIADRKQEFESEYERLTEQKVILQKKYKQLTQTANLLQEAKDKLTTGYMGDMLTAFHKYLDMIDHSDVRIQLNADLDTHVEEHGKQWKSSYLSRGYKDLVNICIRIALTDVMYQKEKPFLILDDPFVNLDDSKMEQAFTFLRELAAETQVFYFVCHESRALPLSTSL